ncbi:hypothetical protein BJ165DRAFT_1407601 [Panaeolus papilionaceus]|nr:hypothetical protein BJ165DRAFT_1407601 [Panaeolus papilionaceus]
MAFRKHSNLKDRHLTPLRSSWNTIDNTSATTVPSSKTEAALNNLSKKSLKYEHLMKDLESRLMEDLGNFRRVDSLLQDVNSNLQGTLARSNRSVQIDVPQIKEELHQSMGVLNRLEKDLPETQSRVSDICYVYDSGQKKAVALVSDLTWLNTEFYERWRAIIFTSSSPVSWRWKACMRSLFIVSFIMCFWLSWIALLGAYRAHRHKLVWGDKLMS